MPPEHAEAGIVAIEYVLMATLVGVAFLIGAEAVGTAVNALYVLAAGAFS